MFKSSSLPTLVSTLLLVGGFQYATVAQAQAQAPLRGTGLSHKTLAKPALSSGREGVDSKLVERWQSGSLRGFRLKAGSLFDAEQSRLTPSGEKLLKQLESSIAALGKHSGFIWCYADGIGFDAFQRDLTLKRAQKVKLFLQEGLATVSSYDCKGWGKERPQSYAQAASVLPPARNEHVLEIIVDLQSLWQGAASGSAAEKVVDEGNGRDNFAKHLGLQSANESDVTSSLQGEKVDDQSPGGAGQLGLQVRPGQGLVVPKEEFSTVIPHEKVGQERDKMTPDELKKLEEEEKRRSWEQREFGVWREHR